MKRIIFLIVMLSIILAHNFTAKAQFTTSEIAQREDLEEFLKTAEILGHEILYQGITKPFRLHLKKGELERYGVWKNIKGFKHGALEGWQYEIAAYEMDKLLGLNMVPPTVERRYIGKRGSLQLWIDHKYSLLEIIKKNIPISPSEYDNFNKTKYLRRAFDSLIANNDRTQENTLYIEDWRMILIDHSRSFRSSNQFTKKLIFSRNNRKNPSTFRQLPRAFVEKIKTLDFDSIKKAVGHHLTDKEIKAILIRKELILKEIEEMIKELGENYALY